MCNLHIMLSLLDRLLAPLARLLVARGILFPDFAERMKLHYLAAAKGMSDGKTTDSRLSVLTGLQRRDIARLRALPQQETREHHLARLIALWQTEPDYQGRDLPKNGPAPSFDALAQMVRKDIHARTMLDALAEAGAVTVDPATHAVRLIAQSYQPLAGSEDQLAYLTENLGDHFDATTENVLSDRARHFERAVYYSGLTDTQVEDLRAIYEAEQMQLFRKLSRTAADMKKKNLKDANAPNLRFRAGGYFYTTRDARE